MNMESDANFFYNTLQTSVEDVILKEKGSKFIGFAAPVKDEAEAKNYMQTVKTLHPKATHHCFAYKLGLSDDLFRLSDDGEPGGTAGLPIYNQILSFDLTNVIVIVVRYYGGTKLGVSGLIKAYRETAKAVLAEGNILTVELQQTLEITVSYAQQSQIFALLNKFQAKILNLETGERCLITAEIGASHLAEAEKQMAALQNVSHRKI